MRIAKYMFVMVFLLFLNCKQTVKQEKIETEVAQENNSENKQVQKDGIVKYDFNLTMEWALRADKLIITKDSIYGNVKQKVEGVDNEFTTTELEKKIYLIGSLEGLTKSNLHRTKKKENALTLLNVIEENDTITFYSYNLADKSKFIREYFAVMKSIYPQSDNFEYPED